MRSVKEALVGCATTRIALLDSSKFHSRGLYTFCDFDALDILITVENEENAPLLEEIARHRGGCSGLVFFAFSSLFIAVQ